MRAGAGLDDTVRAAGAARNDILIATPSESMHDVFTFVLQYAGGTYISQHNGRSAEEAFARWLSEDALVVENLGVKFAKQLARHHARYDDRLVTIEGVIEVWCWSAALPKGLALLNIVRTGTPRPRTPRRRRQIRNTRP